MSWVRKKNMRSGYVSISWYCKKDLVRARTRRETWCRKKRRRREKGRKKDEKIDTVSISGNDYKVSTDFQPTNQSGLHSSPSENDLESVIDSSPCRERQKASNPSSSPGSVNSHLRNSGSRILLNSGIGGIASASYNGLSEDQIRFSEIRRKKDFSLIEHANGKRINVVQGLELHSGVFDAEEQKKIVKCVYDLQQKGQKGLLRERTYSEPKKWMRGKGRITIQFGCCYNYAADKNGNPPGILRDEEVDPLPPLFKQMIKRMIRCHVLPPTRVPNSCIVNIYDEGDCIPPHIDHHDFLRPFCTVSFLTECNILFGSSLKIVDAGEFSGPFSLPLPCGSVLILNGNGADIAKHCVPGVPGKRISITFRKMDDSKLPFKFSPDPELLGIKPLGSSPSTKMPYQQKPLGHSAIAKSPMLQNNKQNKKLTENASGSNNTAFSIDTDDFPPLGGPNSSSRPKANKVGLKQ